RVSFDEIPGGVLAESDAAREAVQAALNRLQLRRVPSSAWKEKMAGHVELLGHEPVADRLCGWFHKVPKSKPGMLARNSLNREMLRGLLYLCCDLPGSGMIEALAHATRFFYQNNSPLAETGIIVLHQLASKASLGALGAMERVATSGSQLAFVR